MAYKYKERMLKVGKAWIDDDGIQHPYNWAASWSADDLKKWNVSVITDDSTYFDDRFYWSKGVEKSLDDILVTDDDGKKVLNPETGKQMVQLGLKNLYIIEAKAAAKERLSKTDWQITRKAEKGTAIDSSIATYRDNVRAACDTIETKINNCSNLSEFMALFVKPENGNPPISDWPDEVS